MPITVAKWYVVFGDRCKMNGLHRQQTNSHGRRTRLASFRYCRKRCKTLPKYQQQQVICVVLCFIVSKSPIPMRLSGAAPAPTTTTAAATGVELTSSSSSNVAEPTLSLAAFSDEQLANLMRADLLELCKQVSRSCSCLLNKFRLQKDKQLFCTFATQ